MIKQFSEVDAPGGFHSPFFYQEDGLKIEIKWDEEAEEVLLFLDGQLYDTLPWLPADFCEWLKDSLHILTSHLVLSF